MIFEPSKTHPIFWSDYSLLEADIVCMNELLKRSKKWKHFVNQAGTVMPQIDIRLASSKITTFLGQRNDSIFSMHVITFKNVKKILLFLLL